MSEIEIILKLLNKLDKKFPKDAFWSITLCGDQSGTIHDNEHSAAGLCSFSTLEELASQLSALLTHSKGGMDHVRVLLALDRGEL